MRFTWIKRTVFLIALLMPVAASSDETVPALGEFLVAAPGMVAPEFAHAVILLVRHDKTGAFGIIINRPLADRPITALLRAMGRDSSGVTGAVHIYSGGPVDRAVGFIVHSAEYHHDDTIAVDRLVAVTSNPQVLTDMGHGSGPAKGFLAFGYTGWSAGQLEDEIKRGAWFMEPEDSRLIFDEDPDKVWDAAVARRPVPL